jgi:flavin reductase (DIM6/NTAB) family NADH-FMN oxidoreductase RutF
MISIDPKITTKLQGYLQGSVGPGPLHLQVLLMQTETNLSPFSFFNVFSANPPILVFLQDAFAITLLNIP